MEAIRQKHAAGTAVPIASRFRWAPNGKVEIDPDRRVQEAVHLVFTKMWSWAAPASAAVVSRREDRSAGVSLACRTRRRLETAVYNTTGTCSGIRCMRVPMPSANGIQNQGHRWARSKERGHFKSRDTWMVLIRDHHPGYISWSSSNVTRRWLSDNAHMNRAWNRRPVVEAGAYCRAVALPALRGNACM